MRQRTLPLIRAGEQERRRGWMRICAFAQRRLKLTDPYLWTIRGGRKVIMERFEWKKPGSGDKLHVNVNIGSVI